MINTDSTAGGTERGAQQGAERRTAHRFSRFTQRASAGVALATLTLAIFASQASADTVYRSTDAQGRTVYSDQPPSDDAQPVEMPPLIIFESERSRPGAEQSQETEAADDAEDSDVDEFVAYADLSIISPTNDQAIRSNNGDVAIHTRLQPPLQPGHRLQLILNGSDAGVPATPAGAFQLTNVDRGTHVALVRVIDDTGRTVITSRAVEFHVLRVSVLTPPAR